MAVRLAEASECDLAGLGSIRDHDDVDGPRVEREQDLALLARGHAHELEEG